MEAELFSSSHPQQLESGILGRFILFTGNPTEASLTARCSTPLRENSMGPLTTVAATGLHRDHVETWLESRVGSSCSPFPGHPVAQWHSKRTHEGTFQSRRKGTVGERARQSAKAR